MEQEIRNTDFDNIDETILSNDRLESFAASEMADRGPKTMGSDTDDASLRPVSNVNDEDEDLDDEDEEMDDDAIEIDEVDADKVEDDALITDDAQDDADLEDFADDDDDEEDDKNI